MINAVNQTQAAPSADARKNIKDTSGENLCFQALLALLVNQDLNTSPAFSNSPDIRDGSFQFDIYGLQMSNIHELYPGIGESAKLSAELPLEKIPGIGDGSFQFDFSHVLQAANALKQGGSSQLNGFYNMQMLNIHEPSTDEAASRAEQPVGNSKQYTLNDIADLIQDPIEELQYNKMLIDDTAPLWADEANHILEGDAYTYAESIDGTETAETNAQILDGATDEEFTFARPEALRIFRGIESLEENLKPLQEAKEKESMPLNEKSLESQPKRIEQNESSERESKPSRDSRQDNINFINENTRAVETRSKVGDQIFKGAAEVNRNHVLSQIYDRIRVVNLRELSELSIKLRPESLGEVAIKLVMDKGMLTGRILVENNQVKNLIESSLPEIEENLRAQNPDATGISITVDLGGKNPQFNDNPSFGKWGPNLGKREYTLPERSQGTMELGSREASEHGRGLDLLA